MPKESDLMVFPPPPDGAGDPSLKLPWSHIHSSHSHRTLTPSFLIRVPDFSTKSPKHPSQRNNLLHPDPLLRFPHHVFTFLPYLGLHYLRVQERLGRTKSFLCPSPPIEPLNIGSRLSLTRILASATWTPLSLPHTLCSSPASPLDQEAILFLIILNINVCFRRLASPTPHRRRCHNTFDTSHHPIDLIDVVITPRNTISLSPSNQPNSPRRLE